MTNPLLIHIHVPKCAGTTVEEHLEGELGSPGFWSAPKRTRKFPLELFGRKYDSNLPGPAEQVRAVSGHFAGRSLAKLFPGRRIVRSLILREPKSLMLSYYNFRMMLYLSKGQSPYSFSLFLRSMRMNPVTHFLLARWAEMPWIEMASLPANRKVAILDKMLGEVDYVDDISQADSVIASISRAIGIAERAPRRNTAAERLTETRWKLVRYDDLSEEDRRLLKSRTRVDRYLWRRWAMKENVAFEQPSVDRFLRSEFVRPGYQIKRRTIRRFGSMLGLTAQA
jgi:hypothetical protein